MHFANLLLLSSDVGLAAGDEGGCSEREGCFMSRAFAPSQIIWLPQIHTSWRGNEIVDRAILCQSPEISIRLFISLVRANNNPSSIQRFLHVSNLCTSLWWWCTFPSYYAPISMILVLGGRGGVGYFPTFSAVQTNFHAYWLNSFELKSVYFLLFTVQNVPGREKSDDWSTFL